MKIKSHRLLTLTPCAQSALCFVAICTSVPLHAQAHANAVAAGTLGEIRVQGATGSGTLRATSQSAAGFGDKPLLDTPFQVNVFTEKLFTDQQARSICDPFRPLKREQFSFQAYNLHFRKPSPFWRSQHLTA